jgi:hypothetical protein
MSLVEKIGKLRDKLSPGASINLASDEAFEANKKRWSEYKAPQPGAVVNVATEGDIEQTVCSLPTAFCLNLLIPERLNGR